MPKRLPGSLWYNGDFNGVNGLANGRNFGFFTQAAVYDDFNVTAPLGWNVTAVFSDNLAFPITTGADWEIRTGISEGNAGTLIASGTTNSAVVIPTGRSHDPPEYMVEITGLNLMLPALQQANSTGSMSRRSATARAVRTIRPPAAPTASARPVATIRTHFSTAPSSELTLRLRPMRAYPTTSPMA